jgi:hypothetical protein
VAGKEKSAGILSVFRVFLTQAGVILAETDKVLDLTNNA